MFAVVLLNFDYVLSEFQSITDFSKQNEMEDYFAVQNIANLEI